MSALPTDDPRVPFLVFEMGRFSPARLEVRFVDDLRPTTDELERLIAGEWERRISLAQGTDRLLFNGPLLRYVRHVVDRADDGADRFILTVGPTCYRDFVGTNLYNNHRVAEFGWRCFSNPVGTTATLLTADHCICYGRRSQRVSYHAGFVHTFGGALEGQDRADDGSINPFSALRRELAEELALEPGELDDVQCAGLIRDREILQPELLFEARIGLESKELVDRWRSAECRDEHDEVVQLADRADAVIPFLQSCGPIAPVAVGALLLHGFHCWGQSWYDATAQKLQA